METFKLIFMILFLIPVVSGGIAGLYLIVLCCIRDIREVNEFYENKKQEIDKKYNNTK